MTLAEFKAWFDGFTEDMDEAPSKKQWDRIKARVGEINGVTVTERVFVDRYVEPYRRYWPAGPYWSGCAAGSIPATSKSSFNNFSAMLDLGKAEYKAALS